MSLAIRVALGRRKVAAQFLGRATRTVAGGIALDAPPAPRRSQLHVVAGGQRHAGIVAAIGFWSLP
jgi:hypothetical protein